MFTIDSSTLFQVLSVDRNFGLVSCFVLLNNCQVSLYVSGFPFLVSSVTKTHVLRTGFLPRLHQQWRTAVFPRRLSTFPPGQLSLSVKSSSLTIQLRSSQSFGGSLTISSRSTRLFHQFRTSPSMVVSKDRDLSERNFLVSLWVKSYWPPTYRVQDSFVRLIVKKVLKIGISRYNSHVVVVTTIITVYLTTER